MCKAKKFKEKVKVFGTKRLLLSDFIKVSTCIRCDNDDFTILPHFNSAVVIALY